MNLLVCCIQPNQSGPQTTWQKPPWPWTVKTKRSDLLWSWWGGPVWACMSAVSLWRQWHDILDFSCCPLSRVLHVTLANLQKFGFEFHLRSSPSAFSGWSADQLITSLVATTCWRDPTRSKQLSTVAILGFQFGLYHVVVPLSFLRIISLVSCFLKDTT